MLVNSVKCVKIWNRKEVNRFHCNTFHAVIKQNMQVACCKGQSFSGSICHFVQSVSSHYFTVMLLTKSNPRRTTKQPYESRHYLKRYCPLHTQQLKPQANEVEIITPALTKFVIPNRKNECSVFRCVYYLLTCQVPNIKQLSITLHFGHHHLWQKCTLKQLLSYNRVGL